MEKIACIETVTEVLEPNGELVDLTEDEIVERYFARETSYSRRMTTNTEETEQFWNEHIPTMKTYIVKGEGFKYLVYDFMYVIDADTDEDGEVTDIHGVCGFFTRPIKEVA